MAKLSIDLEASIRNALIEAIVKAPNTTVADLLDLVRGEHAPLLRALTLGELADSMGGSPRSPTKTHRTTTKQRSNANKATVNTRTAEGRAAYDKAIHDALSELGGGPVSGPEVKAKVGGTSLQVRTALNRLIEAGVVTFTGKARGTRYSLA